MKRNKAVIELQDQVGIIEKMVKVKKALKEPPYFDVYSLDITVYLRLVQTCQDYFEGKGHSNEESFVIGMHKL